MTIIFMDGEISDWANESQWANPSKEVKVKKEIDLGSELASECVYSIESRSALFFSLSRVERESLSILRVLSRVLATLVPHRPSLDTQQKAAE